MSQPLNPLDLKDKVLVDRAWYETACDVLSWKHGCPHCGSQRQPIYEKPVSGVCGRNGCLDCNAWVPA